MASYASKKGTTKVTPSKNPEMPTKPMMPNMPGNMASQKPGKKSTKTKK